VLNSIGKEIGMNHWLAEELIRLNYAERQRELEAIRLQNELNSSRTNWTFVARAALKLSDWLIVIGKNLRKRFEKATPASSWVDSRKFAR
jgi:hypothetical protein